jgi:hypothetical protein
VRQDQIEEHRAPPAGFVVRGIVEGRPAVARWEDGQLHAEPELLRRAEVVVGMGESFTDENDPTHVVMASLQGGGYDVMLTVMRAFSRVTSIELPLDVRGV